MFWPSQNLFLNQIFITGSQKFSQFFNIYTQREKERKKERKAFFLTRTGDLLSAKCSHEYTKKINLLSS